MLNAKNSRIDLDNMPIALSGSRVDKKKYKDRIPITSDGMFKTIFGREEYIKFPCKLLSYLVDIDYEVLLKNLKFSKNETGKKSNNEKSYRNDLVVKLDDITINIEMNNNSSSDIRERNIDYIYRLRSDNKYNQIIQVNINNYKYYDDTNITRNYYVISEDNKLLTNKILIIDVYLPNIKEKCYNNIKLTEMERFLLIGIEEDKKKALEYVGDDIIMKEFEELIEERSKDDDLFESYDKEWALEDQAKRDGFDSGYIKGKEDGFNDGITQGIEEGKKEVIDKLISKGMSIEEISSMLDIDINKIKDIIDKE